MNFSDDFKVCWYTPQRTATRSIRSLLESLNFIIRDHDFILEKSKENYELISNIRNPYSRMSSIFMLYSFHNKNYNYDFKQWVKQIINHKDLVMGYQINYHENILKNRPEFFKFIRVESLVEDIKKLNFVDLSNPKINEVYNKFISNNSYSKEFEDITLEPRKNWKDYWDEETAENFYEKLKTQFEFFGYEKNSWKYGTS